MALKPHPLDPRAVRPLSPAPAKAKRLPPRAGMNKTEARYAQHLDLLVAAGKVRGWGYQRIKLRLADDTQYIPDFDVQVEDGTLEFHEVKGHWEDDARVKIKVAANSYPWYGFRAIQWDKETRGWKVELFTPTRGDGDHPRVPDTLFAISG